MDYYDNWYTKHVLNRFPIWLADYLGEPDVGCLIQQYGSNGSVNGIKTEVDVDYYYEGEFKMEDKKMYSRSKVVQLANSWLGKNEADGSYKEIIDIYNTLTNPPRGVKMLYGWAWCACTWSAIAIKLGYTSIMPLEISCGQLIEQAKTMDCWEEVDDYIPIPGDGILYDWDDSGVGDNAGWPDHVGIVTYVNKDSGYMEVVEGNYNKAVKKRTISLNGRYIRGFVTPKYDDYVVDDSMDANHEDVKTLAYEVILGKWGSGDARKKALSAAGYDYAAVQSMVNQILNGSAVTTTNPIQNQDQPVAKKVVATCAAFEFDASLSGTYTTSEELHCRNDAGTNKKSLCVIPAGTKVKCYGYYNVANGVKWPYIQFTMDGVQYTGFSSSVYLKK